MGPYYLKQVKTGIYQVNLLRTAALSFINIKLLFLV